MLKKNGNCYNIEKNLKYGTVISTFSEHITIFRTLSIKISQQRQTNKTKSGKLFFCKFFRIIQLYFDWKAILVWKVALTNRNSSAILLHTSKTFSTNFHHQNKNYVIETISCFAYQLSKKYCVYYMSEHLKYSTQINEYLLHKNACLNIVLYKLFNSIKIIYLLFIFICTNFEVSI